MEWTNFLKEPYVLNAKYINEDIWFDKDVKRKQIILNIEPLWKEKTEQSIKFDIFVMSDVSIHYTQSVLELQKYCFNNKIKVIFSLFKSSLVTQGRNLCVAAFLQTKCTHLLFIDSDIFI